MKFTDLDNLNEGPISGPAGFAKRAKAKLQKNIPFARQQQRRGAQKDELFKLAKEIKDNFKQWVDTKTGSSNINNAGITMPEFLEWMQSETDYGGAAEKFARGDKDYKEYFSQEIDDEGKQTSTASDPKVQTRTNNDEEQPGKVQTDDEKEQIKKAYGPGGTVARDAEAEAEELGSEEDDKQDIKASKGEDEKPKVDTSASIYESRFRAILNEDAEDVGIDSAKTLIDNQIDTLIVGALRVGKSGLGKNKMKEPEEKPRQDTSQSEEESEADATSAKGAKAEKGAKASKPSSSGKLSDEDFGSLAEKVQKILRGNVRKIIQNANIDEGEKKKMLSELDTMIVNVMNDIGNDW